MSPDNRNLIAAMVLSLAILIGWQVFYVEPQLEAERAIAQQQAELAATDDLPQASAGKAVSSDAGVAAVGASQQSSDAAASSAPRIAISTPKLSGSFSTAGARLDDLVLLDYQTELNDTAEPVRLLHKKDDTLPYFMETGWVSADASQPVPASQTIWQTDDTELTPDKPVRLFWDNQAGLVFERLIAIDEDYLITITDTITSNAESAVTINPYGLVRRHGTPETTGIYILHEGPMGVFDGQLSEKDYGDLRKAAAEGLAFTPEDAGGWIGITDKYWLTALIPNQTENVSYSMRALGGAQARYQTDFLGAAISVAPGEQVSWTSHMFAGAKKLSVIDAYGEQLKIENFDLAIDFGWFYFLTKPFFYALNILFGLFGNFGLAIIAFTIVIRIVMYPLASKSYRSMGKMRQLAPKIQEMRERHGDDRTKLNQEMMTLYKTEKVNPAAGCLPILVQIPIFFALYKVLYVSIEMRHAPFYGWIQDLSDVDPTSILNLFGLLPYSVDGFPQFLSIGVWPILMGVSMWVQMRLNPAPPDPIQAKIFQYMPIFFTFLLAGFPAGLVIYWTVNNLLSVAQQWWITRSMQDKKS